MSYKSYIIKHIFSFFGKMDQLPATFDKFFMRGYYFKVDWLIADRADLAELVAVFHFNHFSFKTRLIQG